MKYIFLFLIPFFPTIQLFAQTNPAALSLPVLQDFGTTTFNAPKPGMASWTGDGTRPYTTQATAEASGGGADQSITAGEPSSGGAGGQYGGAPGANARLSILQSSNSASGSSQIIMAVNTTGATAVTIAYDLTMPVVNPRDIGLVLQYRVGTSGLFTTITGSAVIYNNTSTNGGDADGPADYDNYSFSLPAAGLNQAVVQLRWASWSPTGTGSRNALGIDNISIISGVVQPCAEPLAQPSGLTLTPGLNNIAATFTAPVSAPNNYLVVYSTTSTLSQQPADGVNYTAGQSFGGGIIGQITNIPSFNITGLIQSTQYYFFIYSFNNIGCSGGPNYLITAPLSGNTTTLTPAACTTPAAGATALVLTPTSTTINGSFTASATANRYLVVRSNTATLSAAPVNGTTYVSGASFGGGTVVQYGTGTSFSNIGLNPNTIYYYFVFAANGSCSGEPFYFNTALNGNTTTLNGGGPANYYAAANGLSCTPLKTALYNIISTGTTVLSYTPGVWNAYQTTDLTRNFENNRDIIFDMYSNRGPLLNEPYEYVFGTDQCGNYSGEGDCYNREHSFPKSWFGDVLPMNTDIHHVVPTDGFVNNTRGNFAFGPVGTTNTANSANGSKRGTCNYPGFSGIVFEPINEFKGDFARMQLYMAVRYENLIASWQNNSNANDVLNGTSYQAFDDWYLKMLFDWHIQDPVSAKEVARNNAVYAIQGNRNPFIDSPQYVLKIWSCTNLLPNLLPATPVVLNVSNKCVNDPSAKGKLSNPPLTGITVQLDGSPITYNTVDSSFQYYTNSVTTTGNHTVRVIYTNTNGTSQKDTAFTVNTNVTPTVSITGIVIVNSGQSTTLASAITNGGAIPNYQWQDSTGVAGWQNITGATNSTIVYTPLATGHKIRCRLTSAVICATPSVIFSNALVFTVNTATALNPVNANNYGIRVFPNPVKDILNLTSLRLSDKWQSVEVINIEGKTKLLYKNIQNQSNLNINMKQLPGGVYYLLFRKNNGRNAYIKFVKL